MREWSERAGFTVKSHADNFAVTTKTAFSRVGFQLNRVTGYEAIEMLKRQVTEQGMRCFIFFY
jgi:sensitive to high expression protein 9